MARKKQSNMVVNLPFNFGEMVYLRTDPEKRERIVCEVRLMGSSNLLIAVACENETSWHYPFELQSI